MSETYQGVPSNVVRLVETIAGVTAGPNSQVTTATPHGFSSGDAVAIIGVVGITGVNTGTGQYFGTPWTITVTGPSTFTINNGATTGTYTSGGGAYDLFLNPPLELPTDGDSLNAASVNNAFQQIADQLQFLNLTASNVANATFTANGSWTAPPGCHAITVVGWGGGGGGEGGFANPQVHSAPKQLTPFGAGGAGAPLTVTKINVGPGNTYSIAIGAGGAGGSPTDPGADGSPSTITFGGIIVECPGGAGGGAGAQNTSTVILDDGSTAAAILQPGGSGVASSIPRRWPVIGTVYGAAAPGSNCANAMPREMGSGGSVGWTVNTPGGGTNALNGGTYGVAGPFGPDLSPGGAPGTTGISTSVSGYSAPGGSGGGGGGGGPGGAGGAGGNGGEGSAGASSTGSAGTSGTAAAANTGAGGGGAGCGGAGATPGASGSGGNGGSGQIIIFWQTGVLA